MDFECPHNVCKSLPLNPVLSQIYPIHTHLSSFFKIRESQHYSPSMSRSFKSSLPFSISDQNCVCISLLSHAFYMPHPSHPPQYVHPNGVRWRIQIMKLIINHLHLLVTSSFLGPNILSACLGWRSFNFKGISEALMTVVHRWLLWQTKFHTTLYSV